MNRMSGFDKDHVASPLADKGPTILDKGLAGLSSTDGGEAGHGGSGDGDLYKTGF